MCTTRYMDTSQQTPLPPPTQSTLPGEEDALGTVVCRGCGKRLQRHAFPPSALTPHGRRRRCRICKKEENRRYFETHRGVFIASEIRRRKAWREEAVVEPQEVATVTPSLVDAVIRRWSARCFVTG